MSMLSGVEVRVPYLDRDLCEFAVLIPPNLKIKGFQSKWILKKVMEEYLPKKVIHRSKIGFGMPKRDWYKNEFPDGGVILDAFLHSDGTREIIYHHGPGCACCGDANIKFKTVRFYDKDDPRKIIKDYSFTNQILSNEDIEYLSKQIGANSFKIKMDSMNNINLSSLKLNNYFFNNLKIDFVILKKKADFFY